MTTLFTKIRFIMGKVVLEVLLEILLKNHLLCA